MREDKGSKDAQGGDLIMVFLVSATGESVRQGERLNDPGAGFSHSLLYHSILLSQNHYKLPDFNDVRK